MSRTLHRWQLEAQALEMEPEDLEAATAVAGATLAVVAGRAEALSFGVTPGAFLSAFRALAVPEADA